MTAAAVSNAHQNGGKFSGRDESVRRDFFPFLGKFIHDHVKHLADVLYCFFSGITPSCGSDGFESGTVRPECDGRCRTDAVRVSKGEAVQLGG